MLSETFYEIRQINDFRDLLKQSATLFPSRAAFKVRESDGTLRDITYPALLKLTQELGTALCSLGLKGEKIAVIGKNSHKWCTAYFAVTCGAGVIVPIDRELPEGDILNILTTAGCKGIFFDEKAWDKISLITDKLPSDMVYIAFNNTQDFINVLSFDRLADKGRALLEQGVRDYLDAEINSEGLGSLIFTSGTTGMAKGVMLSQKNICEDIMAVSKVVKLLPDDTILSVLPLHHTYECSLSFMMLMYSGGCLCFCEGLRYIQRDMQIYEPTVFVTVPLMLEKMHARILKKVSEKKVGRLALTLGKVAANSDGIMSNLTEKIFAEVKKQFGGKLRVIITGAAALNPDVARDFKTFGIPVYIGYGLTECAPLVIGNNDRLQLPDSVGVPLPGVEAIIHNPDVNGIGEIYVKGPMVMLGYFNDEEATRAAFTEDGFFRTGDMGTVDSDNCFRIVGRCKNVIVTKNGKNIYPEEVEFYLNKSPFVSESLVFGTDCDEAEDGTQVEAKIFPDIAEIMAKLKSQTPTREQVFKIISDAVKEVNKKLPHYKRIRRFDVRDTEFIKTTTNKIKRQDNLDSSDSSDSASDE